LNFKEPGRTRKNQKKPKKLTPKEQGGTIEVNQKEPEVTKRNRKEPEKNGKTVGTRRNQKEPKGTKKNQREGTRRKEPDRSRRKESKGTRRNQKWKRRSQKGPEIPNRTIRNQKESTTTTKREGFRWNQMEPKGPSRRKEPRR
jgi:hypothetical protein